MTWADERLRGVWEPEVVAVPPTNPVRDLMLLPTQGVSRLHIPSPSIGPEPSGVLVGSVRASSA